MSENVLDKIRKLKASRPQAGGGRVRGIFHTFSDGENPARLVGSFLEVRTHFIAPDTKRSDRGLCIPAAFQGDDKLQQTINCPDWDLEKESFKKEKTCPICKLRAVARKVIKDHASELSAEEKKFYDALARSCSSITKLKWNIIDRKDPYVIANDNGKEVKVLGLKIASIGMEAWHDINGIFDQVGFDITDPDKGIDICIVKGNNGTRTAYSAKAVIEGISLKVTPLTPEERALQVHDLKAINSKSVDVKKIMDALHEDLRQALEASTGVTSDEEEIPATETVEEVDEVPAAPAPVRSTVVAPKATPTVAKPVTTMPQRPVAKAPVMAKPMAKPFVAVQEPSDEESQAIESALGDDDSIMGDSSAQKKT